MVIGVLQVELLVPHAASLKDKRSVVRSLKDRLHREHQVSVAEVAAQDDMQLAVLGIALVAGDGRRVGEVLDQILAKLRALRDAELGATRRQLLQGQTPDDPDSQDTTDADVADELFARMNDQGEDRP
ncbi:MAG: DUF503 domain-containing protein [Phycisphaerales bacterium]|nr:DUF503 domain-containing protein [Phycisphaerales bacterium]